MVTTNIFQESGLQFLVDVSQDFQVSIRHLLVDFLQVIAGGKFIVEFSPDFSKFFLVMLTELLLSI